MKYNDQRSKKESNKLVRYKVRFLRGVGYTVENLWPKRGGYHSRKKDL